MEHNAYQMGCNNTNSNLVLEWNRACENKRIPLPILIRYTFFFFFIVPHNYLNIYFLLNLFINFEGYLCDKGKRCTFEKGCPELNLDNDSQIKTCQNKFSPITKCCSFNATTTYQTITGGSDKWVEYFPFLISVDKYYLMTIRKCVTIYYDEYLTTYKKKTLRFFFLFRVACL